MTSDSPPVTVTRLAPPADFHALIAADVRSGLTAAKKSLPSKYFYDGHGSKLFEAITELDEYYLTRVETGLLQAQADRIFSTTEATTIVELGSGSSEKTRILIAAMERVTGGTHYMPVDISEDAVAWAAEALRGDFPALSIDGMVGDFMEELHLIPPGDCRLISFLGSTLGNFTIAEQSSFLAEVRLSMAPDDHFLIGLDLVKSPDILIPAYDDAAGVTAQFNRNVLRVINANLDADFDPDGFDHIVRWNEEHRRIEAYLRASRPMVAHIKALDLVVSIEQDEEVHTEISAKFDRPHLEEIFASAGLGLSDWVTDPQGWYALAVGVPI